MCFVVNQYCESFCDCGVIIIGTNKEDFASQDSFQFNPADKHFHQNTTTSERGSRQTSPIKKTKVSTAVGPSPPRELPSAKIVHDGAVQTYDTLEEVRKSAKTLGSNKVSTGTSPPPQEISTQVILYFWSHSNDLLPQIIIPDL